MLTLCRMVQANLMDFVCVRKKEVVFVNCSKEGRRTVFGGIVSKKSSKRSFLSKIKTTLSPIRTDKDKNK